MKELIFENEGKTYKRISKRKAKRLFYEGKTLLVQPSKLMLFNYWHQPMYLVRMEWEIKAFNSFERIMNAYEYFNCNSEMGREAYFYIEEGEEKSKKEACST